MLKALRWPLITLFFSVVLLGVALYIRFGEGDANSDDSTADETSVVAASATENEPDSAPTVGTTPVPTIAPAVNVAAPVPGQLTEALVGNISKLNPLFASFNPVDRDITALIFEGLTTINNFGEIEPDLAERWEVSRDGLEYVFLLRRDIKWQDGEPFTSADVRYTIDVIRDPDFPGDPTLQAFWRTVEMTVIDEYTIRFRLVQPLASFPEQLSIGMVPAHVLEGYPVSELDRHPFNLAPIGTGPYQRETLYATAGQLSISLRVAPTYRERPEGQSGFAIDRIVFRTYPVLEQAIAALARGEVNSVGRLPPGRLASVSGLSNLAFHTAVYPSVGVLIFNWQREDIRYFQSQRVREALALGLDRHGALGQAMGGLAIPAESPLIPGSWAYDGGAAYPGFNPEQARTRLEAISLDTVVEPAEVTAYGAEDEAQPTPEDTDGESESSPDEDETSDEAATEEAQDGEDAAEDQDDVPASPVRQEFSILVLDEPELVALAQVIAGQWSELGFAVAVDAVDQPTYQARLEGGEFDSAIVEYSYAPYADPDPYNFWHVSQYEDGANFGGIRDLRLSEVLERARRETFGINRALLYRDFQRLFTDRVPAITLYHPVYVYIADSRLEGVRVGFLSTPADRFRHIQDWQWRLP
ncbi:MAG: hypothetical protein GYB66_09670 [Chloroflexi bacterium]|nr:hypothetical protein [Chloroflexota bacterium]